MITSPEAYHRLTSYRREAMGGHRLDWANQPRVYKTYEGLEPIPLPRQLDLPGESLVQVARGKDPQESAGVPSLTELSQVFYLSTGLTARSRHATGEFAYRSVPSAGALYPCELYVAVRSLAGAADGLYHFSLAQHALVPLRRGSFVDCPKDPPGSSPGDRPALVFFLTAIFFRSAWKYRDRSYRYHLLDTGHLLENLLLALQSHAIPCDVRYDFDDGAVNRFLGLDEGQEVCLAAVAAGPGASSLTVKAERIDELPASVRAAAQVAPIEKAYPAVVSAHLGTARRSLSPNPTPVMTEAVFEGVSLWRPLPVSLDWPEHLCYRDAVLTRRSRRNFIQESIPRERFEALLDFLRAQPPDSGSLCRQQEESLAVGFLAERVAGYEAGCYAMDRSRGATALIQSGRLLKPMAHICLDQEWVARAGAAFFFALDFKRLESAWGPRGYRYALLTAGRLGQRIYVGAEALGMGCCGIGAFYDGEAATLLRLRDSSVMLYLLCVGPVKKPIRQG